MKKLLFTLVALLMTVGANAFEFDGINLNGKFTQISRAISQRGYSQDPESNSLKGNCHGTDIYLSYNYTDVTEPGHIGQFYVDIAATQPDAFDIMRNTFNVIYHIVSASNDVYVYQVDDDTTMSFSKGPKGVRLTYTTHYYKAPRK